MGHRTSAQTHQRLGVSARRYMDAIPGRRPGQSNSLGELLAGQFNKGTFCGRPETGRIEGIDRVEDSRYTRVP